MIREADWCDCVIVCVVDIDQFFAWVRRRAWGGEREESGGSCGEGGECDGQSEAVEFFLSFILLFVDFIPVHSELLSILPIRRLNLPASSSSSTIYQPPSLHSTFFVPSFNDEGLYLLFSSPHLLIYFLFFFFCSVCDDANYGFDVASGSEAIMMG